MSRTAAQLFEDARQLPPGELEWLVESLFVASAGETETQIAAAWDDEIKRRLYQIDSGAVELIPLEEVRADMDAHIASKRRK